MKKTTNTSGIISYHFKSKKSFFILILSNIFGWGVFQFEVKNLLSGNNKKWVQQVLTSSLHSAQQNIICGNLVGYFKLYSRYLVVVGRGYKISIFSSNIVFRLGNSHRAIYKLALDTRIFFHHKQLLIVNSRFLHVIDKIERSIKDLINFNNYKKKGVYIKGLILALRVSTKKSKF
jgi:ribosomal protein L6P/L9E